MHSTPRLTPRQDCFIGRAISTPLGGWRHRQRQRRTSCRAAVAAVHSTAVAASPPLQRMMTRRRSQFPIARGKLRSCAVPALPTPNIADMIERNALARSRRRLQAAARPLTHQLRCCLCSCGSESALAPLDGPVDIYIIDFRLQTSGFGDSPRPTSIKKSWTRKRENLLFSISTASVDFETAQNVTVGL